MHPLSAPFISTTHEYAPRWGQTMFQALTLLGLGLGGVAAASLDD